MKTEYELHLAKKQMDVYRDQVVPHDLAMQRRFDESVRLVLKSDYLGPVITSAEDFAPQIRQGSTITGAAVESLSFVLMDIASMLAASKGIGHHPGFLVHDSPREADLDIDPYHSLLSELACITNELGGEDDAPFQYIVTTTTEPPADAEYLVRLSLAAYPQEKMLWGQLLKDSSPLLEI